MYNLLLIGIVSLFLSGCSFLPRFTFDKPGVTPTQTERSYKKESCKGEYRVDATTGLISYCSRDYRNYENNYKQSDRAYTWKEKVANFIRNLTGWGIPLVILAAVFIPGFGGALLGFILNNILNIPAKGFKMLVKGIQDGKNYVRENGYNYNDAERKIYVQSAEDMLSKISEGVTDEKVKKEINILRSTLK